MLGTLGLSEDDLEAVRQRKASRMRRAYIRKMFTAAKEAQQVLHVESIPEDMNLLTPKDGAVPATGGMFSGCVVCGGTRISRRR